MLCAIRACLCRSIAVARFMVCVWFRVCVAPVFVCAGEVEVVTREARPDELQIRQTGSMQWRIERGEAGPTGTDAAASAATSCAPDPVAACSVPVVPVDTTTTATPQAEPATATVAAPVSPTAPTGNASASAVSSSVPASSPAPMTLKALVGVVFKQLTQGCGATTCSNSHCKSSPAYTSTSTNANEWAQEALQLCHKMGTAAICSKP